MGRRRIYKKGKTKVRKAEKKTNDMKRKKEEKGEE